MLASPCALASEVISACVRSSGFSRTHDAQRLNLKMRLLPDRTALKRLEHLLGESSEQLRTSGSYSRPGSAGSGIVEASSKAQTRTPPRPWREPPFLLWRWHALACKRGGAWLSEKTRHLRSHVELCSQPRLQTGAPTPENCIQIEMLILGRAHGFGRFCAQCQGEHQRRELGQVA